VLGIPIEIVLQGFHQQNQHDRSTKQEEEMERLSLARIRGRRRRLAYGKYLETKMNLNNSHACSELAAEGAMIRLGYAHVIPSYNNEIEKEMMKNRTRRTRSLMLIPSSTESFGSVWSEVEIGHGILNTSTTFIAVGIGLPVGATFFFLWLIFFRRKKKEVS
jgi:hypothetical protein